ncbi:MAG: hypothetical protein HY873_11400, partial [Chloroflexi bacterium]|nr:hypothetical protein [Chloroflexota bacterium]
QRVGDPDDGVEIHATADDYALARKLLAGPFARFMGSGLSDAAKRFGQRLKANFGTGEWDTREVGKVETVIRDPQTVRQYVRALHGVGVVEQTAENRGPKPARYRIVADLPDDAKVAGLPAVEDVFQGESAPSLGDKGQLPTAT